MPRRPEARVICDANAVGDHYSADYIKQEERAALPADMLLARTSGTRGPRRGNEFAAFPRTLRGAEERPELYTVANVVALIPHLSVTLFSLLYYMAVPPLSEKGPFDGGA